MSLPCMEDSGSLAPQRSCMKTISAWRMHGQARAPHEYLCRGPWRSCHWTASTSLHPRTTTSIQRSISASERCRPNFPIRNGCSSTMVDKILRVPHRTSRSPSTMTTCCRYAEQSRMNLARLLEPVHVLLHDLPQWLGSTAKSALMLRGGLTMFSQADSKLAGDLI